MKSAKASKPAFELGSFRDPSGSVVYYQNSVYRLVWPTYQENYDAFVNSGLKKALIQEGLLLDFTEVKPPASFPKATYKVLKTTKIPFVSYPYEWSLSQLKAAARTTLKIQQIALAHQLSLKDASAYNIQFIKGKPVLIDLLSFERYQEGRPWIAYQQFCQHFLAPLALQAKVDLRFRQLLRVHLDGIPLDLTSKILPKSSLLNPGLLSHIHLHARNQQAFANSDPSRSQHNARPQLPKPMLMGIIDSLSTTIASLQLPKAKTEWGAYYTFTNYADAAFKHKKTIVQRYLTKVRPQSVWDLGGNTGEFARIASDRKIDTVCFDIDPLAVELNVQQVMKSGEEYVLPLCMDLTNQSPAIGWSLTERKSLIERGPADLVMALALIHHLAISNNTPLPAIAQYLKQIGQWAIVEFIPKSDSKVQTLLSTREDIFPAYTEIGFEQAFTREFKIIAKDPIKHGSVRILYLLQRK